MAFIAISEWFYIGLFMYPTILQLWCFRCVALLYCWYSIRHGAAS